MQPFMGLREEHFAAYEPSKWSSNVHNLARMRAKDAMVSLAQTIASGLQNELSGLTVGASDEIPSVVNHRSVDSQWVYWFRDLKAQESLASFLQKTQLRETTIFNISSQEKHLTVAVILRHEGLWFGLYLAPGASVDRQNLGAKLSKAWEREILLPQLRTLGEAFSFQQGETRHPAVSLLPEHVEQLAHQLADSFPAFQLGITYPKAQVLELQATLAQHLQAQLRSVLPAYRYIAWSRENDHIEAAKQIQEEKAQKRKAAVGFQNGDKVRIVSGLFAGKIGVVQGIDSKAQVKIQVGKMAVVVSGSDLRPAP